MSKKIKNMLSILFVAVLTLSAFCIPASAAEDDLTISISTDEKDSVTAKVGDTVKIIAGPFADMVGKVTEVYHDKLKLRAEIEMFGRLTSAEVGFDQIDSVE